MARNKKEKKVKKERKELIWLAIFLFVFGVTEILTNMWILSNPEISFWRAVELSTKANFNVVGSLMTLWGFKTVIEKDF